MSELKIISEEKSLENSEGLVKAILEYEKKIGIRFPKNCKIKMINYKEEDKILSLGYINDYFIKRVNDKFEIYRDKKDLKMSISKMATKENKKTIAFWLQEIEFLEFKMKELQRGE